MTSQARFLSWSLCLAGALAAASSDAAEESKGCLLIQPNTTFDGTGYLHYAAVQNDCSASVRCSLWTDVDPPPQSVEVGAGERAEVVFRRGSPASQFRAFARCQLR